MADLTSALIVGLLGLAAGIFTVLSLIEKPVWPLMRRADADMVSDQTARLIHAELKRLIRLLPPTMITTMTGVLLLLIVQAVLSDGAAGPLMVLGVFVLAMAGIVAVLKKRIDGVEQASSEGDISLVRSGLGALALLHHQGLAAAVVTLAAQLVMMTV